MTTNTEKRPQIRGQWIDEMVHSVGQFVSLETNDGAVREGRLSGLQSKTLDWNGAHVEILTGVELNGDIYDVIEINHIASIRLI